MTDSISGGLQLQINDASTWCRASATMQSSLVCESISVRQRHQHALPLLCASPCCFSDTAWLLQCKQFARGSSMGAAMCMKLSPFQRHVGPVASAALCRENCTRTHLHKQLLKGGSKFRRHGWGRLAAVVDCASIEGSTADQFHLIEHCKIPRGPGKSSSCLISALVHSWPLPSDSAPKPEPPLCAGSRRSSG